MRALLAVILLAGMAAPALSQSLGPFFGISENDGNAIPEYGRNLLPDNFFDSIPRAAQGDIAVEADTLTYDTDANMVYASGHVQMSYDGYLATADRAEYDRSSGDLVMIGNAVVRDPEQVIYTGDRIEVQGDFKKEFVTALAMQTPDGAVVTADHAEYRDRMVAELENGTYAPCGLCVDDKGNQIGWRVRVTKIILNQEEKTLYLERPTVELLGHPIATLPFYWLPDPTDPRSPGFRLPTLDFDQNYGARVKVPFFQPIGPDADLWLTPMLMSRQGFLLDGDFTQRFDMGEVEVRGAGTYQLDPSAYTGAGKTTWRGALQVSGAFTPAPQWGAGWSYQAFSDPGFTEDYNLDGFNSTNDIYAQHLGETTFFDVRAQQFLLQGDSVTPADQAEQGLNLPVGRFDHVTDLPNEWGQVTLNATAQNIYRAADATRKRSGVRYIDGYSGDKTHASAEADWSKQFILGGFAATPFLGLRADAAQYDGTSTLSAGASTLFAATPIAALDLRFPVIATDGVSSYLFEPIAQLVYRGSGTSLVGINNDNAQSFVFDDTNLFSYNKFSGSDRQETGLRANAGGQMQANFADGSWLHLVAGQSYQLAGPNAFSLVDHDQVGNGSGLGGAASRIVAGAVAGIGDWLQVGGKLQVNPRTARITRGGLATGLSLNRFTFDANYTYEAPQVSRGKLAPTHEISADLGVPVADYWTVAGGTDFDLNRNNWTELRASVFYDDKFLRYGVNYTATQDLKTSRIEQYFGIDLRLMGPGDE